MKTPRANPPRPAAGWGTRLWSVLLRFPAVRRRLVFHLTHHHFRELDVRVPLAGGIACPVHERANLHSFAEIFCRHEYVDLWDHVALPRRWIDLGAHAGYFSLDLAARHAAAGSGGDWRAVLVEPDPRLRAVIEDGIHSNSLSAQATLLAGLIGAAAAPGGTAPFALREGMVSARALATEAGPVTEVPVLSETALLAALPPPCDLIKVDIEGGEYDFVRAYPGVLRQARACVIEWHAPTADDPRRGELDRALEASGLGRRITLRGPSPGSGDGPLAVTGLDLFLRDSA